MDILSREKHPLQQLSSKKRGGLFWGMGLFLEDYGTQSICTCEYVCMCVCLCMYVAGHAHNNF